MLYNCIGFIGEMIEWGYNNMALIQCPECGKEISSSAKNCPGCGYPISKTKISLKYWVTESWKIVRWIVLAVFLIAVVLFVGVKVKRHANRGTEKSTSPNEWKDGNLVIPIEFIDEYGLRNLAFIVKNDKSTACWANIKVLFYDENDKVIHVEDNNGCLMAPNEEGFIKIYNIYDLDYKKYEYELDFDEKPAFMKACTNDITLELESMGNKNIVFKCTNNGSDIVDVEVQAVLMDKDGNPVDIVDACVTSLKPGNSDYMSADVYATNYSSACCYLCAYSLVDDEFPNSPAVEDSNVYVFDRTE